MHQGDSYTGFCRAQTKSETQNFQHPGKGLIIRTIFVQMVDHMALFFTYHFIVPFFEVITAQ